VIEALFDSFDGYLRKRVVLGVQAGIPIRDVEKNPFGPWLVPLPSCHVNRILTD
jgi:hypothetical protein